MILCLQVTVTLAVIASCSFANEKALVFNYQPLDVQIFEGNDDRVSLKCNASSNSNDLVYYRWYFKPPNGTFTPLRGYESSEIRVTKPSKKNHGYYLCQAYNYKGSIQSRIAELYVLQASTIQFSVMANFSINWFTLEGDNSEGSGIQRINVTRHDVIKSALESALNSTNIRVKVNNVTNKPGGSEVKAEIVGICADCSLLNDSLSIIEDEVMDINDEMLSLVEYLNHEINNSDFVVAASSDRFVKMQIVMATASNVSLHCPHALSISKNHFFICVSCSPGQYLSDSTCSPCGFGYYQDQQGQTSCKQCPPGSFTDNMGSSSVEECIPEGVSSSSSKYDDGDIIATVVVCTVVVVIVVIGVICYMIYKGYHRRKGNFKAPAPAIVIKNPVVLPILPAVKLNDDNVSEIPTIRYEKPPMASESVKSTQSKLSKKHKGSKGNKLSQEVYKWNRSYSEAKMKRKIYNGHRIPSCYPIGEYVGSLSDNEGDMYDHVTSPSANRRRSMSFSDLTNITRETASSSKLQVPILHNIHAKPKVSRLNSKPQSSPAAVEMDDDMTDLYDSTLRSSNRDRSYTLPQSSNVRLSGMAFSLNGNSNHDSVSPKRESSKSITSVRPVTQYVNNEIVELHRESLTSDAPDVGSRVQSPSQEHIMKFRDTQEEEPAYVTMKPARGKRSLPNLESYFAQAERPPLTKPLSLHDVGPPIELVSLEKQAHRNSIDLDHVVSDSDA